MDLCHIGKQYNNYIAYAIRFFSSFNLSLPVWALFFTGYIGLSLSEATIVYTIGMITNIIFEVPSGTWADRFGRKRVLGAGVLLQAIVRGGYVVADGFWSFIIIELVAGFAGALISGCLISLMYDWYKEQGKEELFQSYSRRHQIILFVARATASLAGGWLFVLSPTLPYQLLVVLWMMMVICVAFLYEPSLFETQQSTSMLHYIRDGWKYLKSNVVITKFVICFLLSGSIIETLWALYQPLLSGRGMSIVHLGWFYAGASLLSAGGSYMTKWFYKKDNFDQMFLIKVVLQICAVCLLFFLPGWRKLLGFALLQIFFGLYWPIINDVINTNVPSSHRATVNSCMGLLDSLQRLVFGGMAGWLFTRVGATGIFLIISGWSILFGVGYCLINRRSRFQ